MSLLNSRTERLEKFCVGFFSPWRIQCHTWLLQHYNSPVSYWWVPEHKHQSWWSLQLHWDCQTATLSLCESVCVCVFLIESWYCFRPTSKLTQPPKRSCNDAKIWSRSSMNILLRYESATQETPLWSHELLWLIKDPGHWWADHSLLLSLVIHSLICCCCFKSFLDTHNLCCSAFNKIVIAHYYFKHWLSYLDLEQHGLQMTIRVLSLLYYYINTPVSCESLSEMYWMIRCTSESFISS